ncbi:MAG: outer membrane beta-barrel protein [Stellaceae bacterium]
MKNTKKGTLSGVALTAAWLGVSSAGAWADELAQQPSAAPTAAAPAAMVPAPAAAPAPAAPTSPLIAPAITGPLAIQLPPPKYSLGPLGNIYVDGIASGLGQWQNNPFPGNRSWEPDLSNGQLFVQKTDGIFQFYAQAGAYSIASLGAPYVSAAQATFGYHTPAGNLWGWFPQGFVKIAPTDNFSIEAGKLPTLIGAEYTFSFENINIERGLLWNQENAVNKGVQGNYTIGPVALSVSVNDGFDSGVFNWVTGSATYTLNPANTFELAAGGNVGTTNHLSSLRTPATLNNSQIYNLIYTYNSDPWIIQPYFQATHVPTNLSLYGPSASTFGGALLVNYDAGSGFNLGGRIEYIGATGGNNLLYGPGSGAFSFTITPTYQWKHYFARAEFSWVKANSVTGGEGLGPNFNGNSQTRVMVETGILF